MYSSSNLTSSEGIKLSLSAGINNPYATSLNGCGAPINWLPKDN